MSHSGSCIALSSFSRWRLRCSFWTCSLSKNTVSTSYLLPSILIEVRDITKAAKTYGKAKLLLFLAVACFELLDLALETQHTRVEVRRVVQLLLETRHLLAVLQAELVLLTQVQRSSSGTQVSKVKLQWGTLHVAR